MKKTIILFTINLLIAINSFGQNVKTAKKEIQYKGKMKNISITYFEGWQIDDSPTELMLTGDSYMNYLEIHRDSAIAEADTLKGFNKLGYKLQVVKLNGMKAYQIPDVESYFIFKNNIMYTILLRKNDEYSHDEEFYKVVGTLKIK